MPPRLPRSARPADGSMYYPLYRDENGHQHEPLDHSPNYDPNTALPDTKDNGPVPTLPPSKRTKMSPSVAISRSRGESVQFKTPPRFVPATKATAQSNPTANASRKQPVMIEEPRPSFQRAEAPSTSTTPVQQNTRTLTKAEKHEALNIQCISKNCLMDDNRLQRYIIFSARHLPTEQRDVRMKNMGQNIELYTKWAMMDASERRDKYKDEFGKYLKAKLK